MNVKSFIPLIAAVLLGLIALVVARKALTKTGSANTTDPVIGVVVATKDLPAGKELTPDDVTVSRLPAESMPSGSFRTVQELTGRTTLQPMVKGQTLVEPMLAPTGSKAGLMGLIPAGMRAMTVEVNEFSGLAGMLQPGARVDVIAVVRDPNNDKKVSARTILQNLEVRAVGRNINPTQAVEGAPPPPPSNNVTLLVTPKQAQIMNLATQNGRPWLVLRNNLDKEQPETEAVTLLPDEDKRPTASPTTVPSFRDPLTSVQETMAESQPFAPPPSRPAARVVQVIRGGVESTVKFESEKPEMKPATPATRPATPPSLFGQGRAMTGTELERNQD